MKIRSNNLITITALFLLLFSGCRESIGIEPDVTPIIHDDSNYRIISPEYATNWTMGSKYVIQWTPVSGITKVNLMLYKKTEFIRVIAYGVMNEGKYTWEIPQLPYQSHHYMIKIVNPSTDAVILESEHFYVFN